MLFQPPADLTDKGTNFISRIALRMLHPYLKALCCPVHGFGCIAVIAV
jgi:hypothetical protein